MNTDSDVKNSAPIIILLVLLITVVAFGFYSQNGGLLR